MFKKIRLRRETTGDVEIKVMGETFYFKIVAGNGIVYFHSKLKQLNRNDRLSLYFKMKRNRVLGDCDLTYACASCPYNKNEKCTYKDRYK